MSKKDTNSTADDLFNDLENELANATSEKVILAALLIDKSGSMASVTADRSGKSRPRIDGACDGIAAMQAYCASVPVLKQSVLLSIGWFGDEVICESFKRVQEIKPRRLTADGSTPLGGGLMKMLDTIQEKVCKLDDEERRFSIPNLCIVSDGAPNPGPDLDAAIQRAAQLVKTGDLNISLVGIDKSDCERLVALGLPGKAFCISQMSWEDAITSATLQGGGTAR